MATILASADVEVEIIDGEAAGCRIPANAHSADGLILLGGAMSANDDALCPHFPELLRLIRDFTQAGKPVLGLCLGGQLIARALGGSVIEQAKGEFGFVPLHARPAAAEDPLLAGIDLPAHIMQWHDDHFAVPAIATHLLESANCPSQAFRADARTYAFQCHFEVDAAIVSRWAGLRAELMGDPDVVGEVRSAMASHLDGAMQFGRTVTERWLALGRVC